MKGDQGPRAKIGGAKALPDPLGGLGEPNKQKEAALTPKTFQAVK
jgi:hypothetical protein